MKLFHVETSGGAPTFHNGIVGILGDPTITTSLPKPKP